MINETVDITETNPMYSELANEISNATDDDLVIVARSHKNRKNSRVKPIAVKNGIYFYVAYHLDDKTAFLGDVTPEQIYNAKGNMMKRVKISKMNLMTIAMLYCQVYGDGLLYCEEFLKAMEQKIGLYYILPSSIHELIFVPTYVGTKDDMEMMVREINATEVSEDDFLANDVFEIGEWT